MSSLDAGISRFWQRVAAHVDVPAESLGIFRWVFGISFLTILAPHSAWIHSLPEALFDPPVASFANLFTSFPPKPTFLILDVMTLVALSCITVGYRTRAASLIFILANVAASNFRFSFGRVDRDFLPTALVACMMLTDWGRYYSFDARKAWPHDQTPNRTARGMALLGVLVAFGMFSSGLPKALKWVDFDTTTSGFLAWFLPNYFSIGRTYLLAPLSLRTPPLVAELADYTAAIFELCAFPALLYSRSAWLGFLVIAAGFHLANSLVLNIPFHDQVIVYLAFIDWSPIAAPLLRRCHGFRYGKMLLAGLVAGVAIWHIASRAGGRGSSVFLLTSTVETDIFDLYVSVPISIGGLGLLANALRSQLRAVNPRQASTALD